MNNAFKNESADPFRALYDELQATVRAVAFRMVGADDVDDVVQMSFVKIWRNQKKYRAESSSKTWAYRITVNTAIDHLRKRKRQPLPLFPTTAEGSVASHENKIATADLIEKALATLSAEHRAVLTLQAFENLDTGSIAAILQIAPGTVNSRASRARKHLAEY
mgnify:CR=1 FL=1